MVQTRQLAAIMPAHRNPEWDEGGFIFSPEALACLSYKTLGDAEGRVLYSQCHTSRTSALAFVFDGFCRKLPL